MNITVHFHLNSTFTPQNDVNVPTPTPAPATSSTPTPTTSNSWSTFMGILSKCGSGNSNATLMDILSKCASTNESTNSWSTFMDILSKQQEMDKKYGPKYFEECQNLISQYTSCEDMSLFSLIEGLSELYSKYEENTTHASSSNVESPKKNTSYISSYELFFNSLFPSTRTEVASSVSTNTPKKEARTPLGIQLIMSFLGQNLGKHFESEFRRTITEEQFSFVGDIITDELTLHLIRSLGSDYEGNDFLESIVGESYPRIVEYFNAFKADFTPEHITELTKSLRLWMKDFVIFLFTSTDEYYDWKKAANFIVSSNVHLVKLRNEVVSAFIRNEKMVRLSDPSAFNPSAHFFKDDHQCTTTDENHPVFAPAFDEEDEDGNMSGDELSSYLQNIKDSS